MKKHTFVILAYLESDDLEDCIKSVLKQSVKYAELGNASFSIHLTGKKKTISSEDKIKTKTLKETNISIDGNISEEELVNIIHDLMV